MTLIPEAIHSSDRHQSTSKFTLPPHQKAIQVQEIGQPLQLITEHPIPTPSRNQVLIRVTVVGLNPHDQKSRDRGLFIVDNLPSTIGNDVVGIIQTLDSSITRFKPGDRVVGQANWGNHGVQMGLQEYAVLDADHISVIPDNISDDEAATLPTNVMAPLIALFNQSKLGFFPPWYWGHPNCSDTMLLIVGGGGNCGKFAVQLAKLAGIRKIVVVGGDESELTEYGASKVLSRHGSANEVLERIRGEVGDDLLYALDVINAPEKQSLVINALSGSKRGKFARLLRSGQVDFENINAKKDGYEILDVFGSSHVFPEIGTEFWQRLPEYLRADKIRPTEYVVHQGLDVDKVNEVLDAYRDGRHVVKTHFHVVVQ